MLVIVVDFMSAEYGDRPLKLVLKVSGNEVTTGSSSLDTFYDEQSTDYDKPKDKKKKKKKDKERSFGSPEKKKVHRVSLLCLDVKNWCVHPFLESASRL